MIRHIVLFTLTATDPAQRAADTEGMRSRLQALVGEVAGLHSVVVEPDLGLIENHWDVVLVSEHDDNEALVNYQAHPKHKEAVEYINGVVTGRATVDYEY